MSKAIKLSGLQTYEKYGKNQKTTDTERAVKRNAYRRFCGNHIPQVRLSATESKGSMP